MPDRMTAACLLVFASIAGACQAADPADETARPWEQAAPGPVDFTGTWELDLRASRSEAFDRIMALQGMNRLERTLLNRVVVTQVIRQETNDVLRLDIRSTFISRQEVQYLDGREMTTTNFKGKAVTTVSSWNQDRSAVIGKMPLKSRDGKPGLLTITRALSPDRKTMYLVMTFAGEGEEPSQALRVFHRKE
ncbi:MAG: hypothetical protein JXR37_15185 [Kiritimatiellae bacterium]|nr:hypothetical protein [Kiritimatiellia bacterium]